MEKQRWEVGRVREDNEERRSEQRKRQKKEDVGARKDRTSAKFLNHDFSNIYRPDLVIRKIKNCFFFRYMYFIFRKK